MVDGVPERARCGLCRIHVAELRSLCMHRSVVMVPDPQLDAAEAAEADVVLSSLEDFRPERWGLPAFTDDVVKMLPEWTW